MNPTADAVAPEIELFRRNATIIRKTVQVNLQGLTHEESLVNPEPGGSCVNWVLGHLDYSYEQVLPHLGQRQVLEAGALERYKRGSPPLSDRSEARELAELLRVWDEASRRVDVGLESLTPDALAQSHNFFGGKSETTLARYLNFILFHQAYHAGQLGLLRRLAGKEGAIP